jgi:hypothetical protein
MTDRCVCSLPHKICCRCFSRLSPAEKVRWLARLGISRSGHATWNGLRRASR